MPITTHKIVVRQAVNAGGRKIWRTDQPVYELRAGESVSIDAGGREALVWIPDERIFKGSHFHLPPGQHRTLDLTVKTIRGLDTSLKQEFALYLVEERRFVGGDRAPRLVINP